MKLPAIILVLLCGRILTSQEFSNDSFQARIIRQWEFDLKQSGDGYEIDVVSITDEVSRNDELFLSSISNLTRVDAAISDLKSMKRLVRSISHHPSLKELNVTIDLKDSSDEKYIKEIIERVLRTRQVTSLSIENLAINLSRDRFIAGMRRFPVKRLSIAGKLAGNLPYFFNQVQPEDVGLSFLDTTNLERDDLAALTSSNLRIFSLSGWGLEEIVLKCSFLSTLENLEELSVSYCKLLLDGSKTDAGPLKLNALKLRRVIFTDGEFEELFEKIKTKTLLIDTCAMHDLGVKKMIEWHTIDSGITKLVVLFPLSDQVFDLVTSAPFDVELCIGNFRITDDGDRICRFARSSLDMSEANLGLIGKVTGLSGLYITNESTGSTYAPITEIKNSTGLKSFGSALTLINANQIERMTNLQSLQISPEFVIGEQNYSRLKSLKKISIEGGGVSGLRTLDELKISNVPNLSEIKFDSVDFTTKNWPNLLGSNLQKIYFRWCTFETRTFEKILSRCRKLNDLTLEGIDLNNFSKRRLSELKLQILELRDCEINYADAVQFKAKTIRFRR